MLDKYGVTSFSKTDDFVIKQRVTSLERFGFENASQCPEIFSKQQKKDLKFIFLEILSYIIKVLMKKIFLISIMTYLK
jgi:hypothetical protein